VKRIVRLDVELDSVDDHDLPADMLAISIRKHLRRTGHPEVARAEVTVVYDQARDPAWPDVTNVTSLES